MSTRALEAVLRDYQEACRIAGLEFSAESERAARDELVTLLEAMKDLREVAFFGPHEMKGTRCRESVTQWRKRIQSETDWVPMRPLTREEP